MVKIPKFYYKEKIAIRFYSHVEEIMNDFSKKKSQDVCGGSESLKRKKSADNKITPG